MSLCQDFGSIDLSILNRYSTGLEYRELVRKAEEVGRRAKVVRVGPAGRELIDAVVVSSSQINTIPDFAQLRENTAYRN